LFIVKNRALSLDNVYYTPYNVFSRDTQGIQIIKTIRGECTYMEYNYYSIGDRIRNLRVQNNMTQDEFKEELGKHGLRIGRNTISSIENGKESAFTFDFLKTASKIFCCDIGYLLGEYNEKKIETHYICEVTGLSEQAINVLLRLKEYNKKTAYSDILSTIIEFGNCEYFLSLIAKRISYHSEKKGLKGQDLVKNMIERSMYLDIDGTFSAVYKDGLIDSILQTEFIKMLPDISNEYLIKYSITPSQRERKWKDFTKKYDQQVREGAITLEEYGKIQEDWFNKKDGE